MRYVVTAVPSGRTCSTTATTCEISGLRNQQAYRFSVRAQSLAGFSPPSALSAAVVPKPYVRITIATRARGDKLWVDVNPDKGAGHWRFVVQRRGPGGNWAVFKGPYTTKGPREQRTVNLPKGTYRVVVLPAYGYQETASGAVSLKR
jgi:Fibronectin type III domain